MKDIIYFDNAATTKPIDKVKQAFLQYCDDEWYNPSALYEKSSYVYKDMEDVRKTIIKHLGLCDGQVVFTSGGTESNNIAILNSVSNHSKCHFITSSYEHDAVNNVFKSLEVNHEVTYIKPNKHGVIDAVDVIENIKDNTVLVSIMHVNNETGAINDINNISNSIKAKNNKIVFHSDGVQAFMKTDIVLSDNIDLYSVSAHKIGGLKGTGALYTKKGFKLKPIMYGGGQEKSIRSGTENTFGIKSFKLAIDNFNNDLTKINELRSALIAGLNKISDVSINSPTQDNLFSPYILNASIIGANGETLLHALEQKGIYIGIGSACSSKKRTNRVHSSINLSKHQSESTIRVSFNNTNTIEQVKLLLNNIEKIADELRIFKKR